MKGISIPFKVFMPVFLFVFLFTGCIDIAVQLQLKKDGTGTITEAALYDDAIVDMIAGITGQMDKSKIKLYDENELQARAAKFGPGVQFKSVERYAKGKRIGYLVTYAFTDINSVTLPINPEKLVSKRVYDALSQIEPDYRLPAVQCKLENGQDMQFTLSQPLDSTHYVVVPRSQNPVLEAMVDTTNKSGMISQLAAMFGFSYRLSVKPEAVIVRADAPVKANNEITLFSVDLGKAIQNYAATVKYQGVKLQGAEQIRSTLPKLPGVQYSLKDIVTVKIK